MGAITIALEKFHVSPKSNHNQGSIVEEIEGLIKVYKTGYVERSLNIVPHVNPSLPQDLNVIAQDVFIDHLKNIWARIYVPKCNKKLIKNYNHHHYNKLPIIVYFHGGGFCLGSPAWKCYHDFLGKLSSQSNCLIMSVNYRLAPENPLPAAYEDGIKALLWLKLKQQEEFCQSSESYWWARNCDFSRIFLGGDSAGANVAYNVALKLDNTYDQIKGIIMIQPFIGGEERTNSEINKEHLNRSVLSLAISDKYWRLALPLGANRDHPWCNLLREGSRKVKDLRVMICIAEKDILRDRNLELCSVLTSVGNKVKCVISQGVGHAFQVLDRSQLSLTRRQEMISHIVDFVIK